MSDGTRRARLLGNHRKENPQMTTSRDYSLTGPEAQRAIDRGLSQAQWYKTDIPRKQLKELMQRSDGAAIRDTALWIGLLALFGTIGVITWWSIWSLGSFFFYGVLYGSASDSRWHEAGHGTAFKTRWMNDVVYQVACFMIMRNPTVWRWSHTRHHTDTIVVGRDPEIIAGRPPSFWRLACLFFGIVDVPIAFRAMFRHAGGSLNASEATFVPDTERRKVFLIARVWLVIYGAVILVAIATRSILPLMLVGLPRMYGAWHHVLTGITQHLGLQEDVTDHRLNSRTVLMNPVSRFIYWNMNYHLEHHMYPMVPFHALPALHEIMKPDVPAPLPGMVAAYREILPTLRRQQVDPTVSIIPTFPATAQVVAINPIGVPHVAMG
jgi:fatty acid desaturase